MFIFQSSINSVQLICKSVNLINKINLTVIFLKILNV